MEIMRDSHDILIRPLLTEKSNTLKDNLNQVCFKVRMDANKIEIGRAVEQTLKVKVASVNVQIMDGKRKRLGAKSGKRPDWKKAIVTLKPGEKLELFEV
jgi:large subunit ribosomal protein L23